MKKVIIYILLLITVHFTDGIEKTFNLNECYAERGKDKGGEKVVFVLSEDTTIWNKKTIFIPYEQVRYIDRHKR